MKNYQKVFISLFGFSAITALIISCGNNVSPNSSFERWIYYPVSTSHGAQQDQTGLYRISLYSGKQERLTNVSVERITSVAKNGIVVLEYGDSVKQKLYGKCEDGRLIPVPFPEPDNANWKYEYTTPPNTTLNIAGHRLAYQVLYSPKTQSDPLQTRSKLIYFNCEKWEMTIIDPHDFIVSQMALQGATTGSIEGEMFFTDENGSGIVFTAAGYKYQNGNRITIGYQLIEWSNDTLKTKSTFSPSPLPLCGIDLITSTAFIAPAMDVFGLSLITGNQTTTSLSSNNLSNRNQFAVARSEIATWGADGIEIRNSLSGTVVSKIISFKDIDFRFGQHRHDVTPNLSISPDGQWITFSQALITDSTTVDLFALRRDGFELKRIGEKLKMGIPVVSDDAKN